MWLWPKCIVGPRLNLLDLPLFDDVAENGKPIFLEMVKDHHSPKGCFKREEKACFLRFSTDSANTQRLLLGGGLSCLYEPARDPAVRSSCCPCDT